MSSNSVFNSYDDEEDNFNKYCGLFLNDRYYIINEIGHGACSVVYICYCIKNKEFYAIKIHNDDDYDIGENEIKILKENKTNIFIKMIDNFEYITDSLNIHYCIVLELMDYSLDQFILKYKISYENKINIFKKIINGVLILHSNNIIHSDLKTDNILVKTNTNDKFIMIKEKFNSILKKNKKTKKIKEEIIKKFMDNNDEGLISNTINTNEIILDNYEKKIRNRIDTYTINNYINYDDIIEKKEILKFDIYLADFGICFHKEKEINNTIQTRNYRAPEIILRIEYNIEKIDSWSLGCILYELIEEKLLFDFSNINDIESNRYHLYLLYKYIGIIPDEMINDSYDKYKFFTKNNLLKKYNTCDFDIIFDKFFNNNNFIYIILKNTLEYNFNNRWSINELYNYINQF